jgi:predicted ABC-type sugar transport system permease subunit
MFRITLVVWMMLGTALAGTAMIAVLIVPDLAAQAMKKIPLAVLAGFVAAIPLSYLVARKIGDSPAR